VDQVVGGAREIPVTIRRLARLHGERNLALVEGAAAMAKMCPIDGCRQTKGLCIHDKMMIVMGLVLMIVAGAHWGLHAF
jgi:hypothetical protein